MKLTTREIVITSLFTALTAVGAFLSIPVGEVPITLQSMFVLLSGLLLGPKLGSLSQLIYVLLGLSGVRIFAGFSGGLQTVLSPSFGFLIGFIFAAYVVGKISHSGERLNLKRIFLASLAGTFTIYIFGVPYMYLILNMVIGKSITFSTALKTGCLIFLPGDTLKTILSSSTAVRILRRVNLAKE
ncbi:biotin transporter BioY [Tepidimicrobium xylanilyticum]|uniref:biotin transporter BioY n=1 Tax=Tepidimicrobium xylanilyticum TaxID=1123352 RepID=UPI0026517D1C|nr:biotin transporter BioY [Tepidimicrobium xylanilyticum]GMG97439.1 biotin transporter BioY [Tepidimicrobium xylanilyticum]